MFTCDIGFNLTGQDYRECLLGEWSGEDPTCESKRIKLIINYKMFYSFFIIVVDCDQLPLVDNGTITYSGFKFWDTATYSCDNGYDLIVNSQNSSVRVCTEEGVWSDDAPFCQSM